MVSSQPEQVTADLQIRLVEFSQAIIRSTRLESLLEIAPIAVERLFNDRVNCRMKLFELSPVSGADIENCWLCVPLILDDQLIGTLLLDINESSELSDQDRQLFGAISGLLSDGVQHHRRMEDAMKKARDEAAELKFDLVAMLSHEMRTPLSTIKGYSSTLLLDDAEWDPATQREFLAAIEEESDRLTELVTDMLDSAVIEAGALELFPEPLLVSVVAQGVITKVARRTDRHEFMTSFPSQLPAVYADEQRILQVLTNLLDNAVKYSPDGGLIMVSAEVDQDEVIVRVADQGEGIAPEHLNKLFERFFRTRRGPDVTVRGTGLGLPIADAIVRAHRGRIWAESTLGKGTTFSFTLPVIHSGTDGGPVND